MAASHDPAPLYPNIRPCVSALLTVGRNGLVPSTLSKVICCIWFWLFNQIQKKVMNCICVLIMASYLSVAELEDMSNIMRVISLKNYCENTRVVIQLLQYQNKVNSLIIADFLLELQTNFHENYTVTGRLPGHFPG